MDYEEELPIILTIKQRNKINRAVKALNDVREELQCENPDNNINWYLEDSSNLNLMSGDSHDNEGIRSIARQDRVIDTFSLWNSSGGGW